MTTMTPAEILDALDPVEFDPGCVVPDDPGEVVRHAAPLDATARQAIREQQIARLTRDDAARLARERRIAIEQGRVTEIRRWKQR